jgi:hypothetical protein
LIENQSTEAVSDVGRTRRLDVGAHDLTQQRRSIMADSIPPMTHATGSPVMDNTNILTAGRRGQQHKHASWA